MINVSAEFKQCIAEDKHNFLVWLNLTLRDGTVLELNNSHIWENSLKIEEGVCSGGELTIGSCIINKLSFTLNNIYDDFSIYDFDGAEAAVYLGLDIGGSIEKIQRGVYIVDEPQYDGSTISLECLDYMSKLDLDYSNVKTVYPASLKQIVNDICSYCKVSLYTAEFQNNDYIVLGRPDDKALTCRQILAYCAQIACCYGRFDPYGRLKIEWFRQEIFENDNSLDGGFFDSDSPYLSGDSADGGGFEDYAKGPVTDGGTFDDMDTYHHLYSMSSFSVSTDDVVITGVEVTEEFTETENDKKQTCKAGYDGYVLSVSENKLIQKGMAKSVVDYLGSKLIGLKFRPMSTQILCDPAVEAGDMAYVTDKKQNTYNCLVTNMIFNLGGYMNVSCEAKTPSRNSSKQYSELTQAIVEARKEAQKQTASLATVIAQSFGAFKTEKAQNDGSIIYYMHDKPTLAESLSVWKFAEDGFAVSTDGGETWNAGLESDGSAAVNILSAIGINCDWIHSGTLTLGGDNNQNGKMVMQDADGNIQGRWNNEGIYTTGPVISDNPKDKYSICIDKGCCNIRGKDGTTTGTISYINGGITIDSCGGNKTGRITITNNGNIMITGEGDVTLASNGGGLNLNGNNIRISGGKTGKAEFSDGSYLQFKGGILVGGKTAGGSTF